MLRKRWILIACLVASFSGCTDSSPAAKDGTQSIASSAGSGQADTTSEDPTTDDSDEHAHTGHSSKPHGEANHAKTTHEHSGHGHGGHAAVKRTSGLKIGEVVPDFEVSLDGKAYKLSELQANKDLTADGTLALTFWCSFCHSCRDVEADLDKLATELKGKAGVVAIDASVGETQEEIDEVRKRKGLTLPIAINADASVADLFGIKVTTTTVVIDSEGVLRYCGQFADRDHKYAAEALAAVMAGSDVAVPESAHRG